MKKYLVLYKKPMAIAIVLTVFVGLFVYTIYTVHTLSVAMNDNIQWQNTATEVINNHGQNIKQLIAALNKIAQQLPAKSK